MKNNPQISFVFEAFWLIVFFGTIIMGLYKSLNDGFEDNYVFFIMSFLALVLYLARRSLRRKNNNQQN